MNPPSLRQFLTTAQWGDVSMGMTAADIAAVIGAPDDVSVRKNPEILKFGSMELGLRRVSGERVLYEINVNCRSPITFPRHLFPVDWELSKPNTLSDFTERVRQWELPFVADSLLSSEKQIAMRINDKVIAVFEGVGHDALLVSVHASLSA